MSGNRRLRFWGVVAITALMATSGLVVLGPAAAAPHPGGSNSAPAAPFTTSSIGNGISRSSSVAARDSAILSADHVPARDVFLPNFNAPRSPPGAVVSPLYQEAPAPMGLGDYGIQDVGGKDVGTTSYTSSIEGVLTLDQLNSTYLDGNGPDAVSIQLNTVLTNVDLFGNHSYQFWIQNVPVYIPHLDQLSILDNVWNFSSSAFDLTPNSFYSYNGTLYPPVYYFASGPTFHTAMPFTVRVYNNASLYQDRPAVYLNYSVTESNGTTVSGSYDRVVFNSTGLLPPTSPAARPAFQINGKAVGANGYLPNDAELMLGGSDDGSTTSVSNVQGTMQLLTLPNGTSTYRSVPAAYDFGTDTGETTEGMAEWASGGLVPTAHLGPGPSFLVPLWGLVGASFGHVDQRLSVTPSNAFVFVSPGATFRDRTAQWAPLPVSGDITYELPAGLYTYHVLLSEYRPVSFLLNGSATKVELLASDPALGVYTPLWAWDNAQLAAISDPGGSGSRANPYVLFNTPATLNPLFGQFNDADFPVFEGILLSYTTDYVTIEDAPSFLIQYSLPGQLAALAQNGFPTFNYLQLQFENASHVSIVNTPVISGWFSGFSIGESLGSLLLWNSSDDLVAGNHFDDMGVSVYVAGGTGNVFWGNNFTVAVPPCADPGNLLNYSNQAGEEIFANGDLTYNNYFDVPLPAVTPTYAPASFVPAVFHDRWNVSWQPASDVRVVNGWSLSGSILGTSYQGGNYWSNYGSVSDPYGVLPYNDGGQITKGGDYDPLLPFALHKVTFRAYGLPLGESWSVTINGLTERSRGATIVFWEPNGVYAYEVRGNASFHPSPADGAVTVHGSSVTVAIGFR